MHRSASLRILLLLSSLTACGGEPSPSDAGVDAAPMRDAARLDAGPPTAESFATIGATTEGIALGRTVDGAPVLYVGTLDDRIVRVAPDGVVGDFASIHAPLGMAVGSDGTLVVCAKQSEAAGGAPGIFAVTSDGVVSTLIANGPDDLPFTLTNYVAIAPDGTLVFTDSGADRVFRADADGTNVALVTDAIDYPNGLAFSPDGATLYVASWNTTTLYSLSFGSGTYGAPEEAFTGVSAIDGIVATSTGELVLVTSARAGIVAIDPDQPSLTPTTLSTAIVLPANGAFGDSAFGETELYVTTLGQRDLFVVHTELMAP